MAILAGNYLQVIDLGVLLSVYLRVNSVGMKTLRDYLTTLKPADQAAFAARCGTTIGYLRKAMSKGQRFDGGLVRQLHEQSGMAVSLTDLRPDIWPEKKRRSRAA